MEANADCIIVGGGIGGAVLALALAEKGRRVFVLERSPKTPAIANRPEVLSSYTINFFKQLGVGEQMLEEAARPLKGIRFFHSKRGILFEFNEGDFVRNKVQPYYTDPARTRSLLIEKASAHDSVDLLHGIEVKELIRDKDSVIGVRAVQNDSQIEFRAPIVVGDDGGNSLIRREAGFSIQTKELPAVFVTTAGNRLPAMEEDIGQGWLQPRHLNKGILGGVFMPLPGNRCAVVFIMKEANFEKYKKGPESFYNEALELSPLCERLDLQFKFPNDFFMIHRPFGHASNYAGNGVAIMGDAAHPVTPVGGQGANASISDAMALSDIIESAIKEKNYSAKRLSEYETLRRQANSRALKFSRQANTNIRLLGMFPFLENILVPFTQHVNKTPRLKNRFIQAVSKTFLSYP